MKVFAFDTETTGLIDNLLLPLDKQPQIIEFYGCTADLETGEISGEIDTLIKPKGAIPEENVKITGITDEMGKDAPPFSAIAPDIWARIQKADACLGHNLSFDMEMVDIELARANMPASWPSLLICTVERTVHLKGYRLSLSNLYEHLFEETFPEAHRAKNDVSAMIRCACELHKRGLLI